MSKNNSNISLQLPDFTLVTASAGSGKTTALTKRYLLLLLAEGIPFNGLRNILAVTFTKNAATEMKERILETLQRAALGEPRALNELQEILPYDEETVRQKAASYIEIILDNYSDFQVQTIDSFITRVLRASAVDLGLPPEFEVDFSTGAVLDEAFDLFAREIALDPAKQQLLGQLIDLIAENQKGDAKFLWNPYEKITKEIHNLYRQLSAHTGEPNIEDWGSRLQELRQEILSRLRTIGELTRRPGLIVSKRYAAIIDLAHAGDFAAVIARELGQEILNKPKGDFDIAAAEQILHLQHETLLHAGEYVHLAARSHYRPYLQAYRMVQHLIEQVKRRRGTVFLGEANRALANVLSAENVPEIYFSLGEQVHHYLIDEFQDTSPIQWAVLRPLIENSLGGTGSLFIVGDTKQSIYTFRGADWRIMRRMMEREEFPSVRTETLPLTTNYRSGEAIVEFTKNVFHERVPSVIPPDTSDRSGLASYEQEVHREKKEKGYVEVHLFDPPATDDEKDEQAELLPEQECLLRILQDCRSRSYSFGDIAILTPRNRDVVEVSRWLNAAEIKILSHSSLDIRTRKLTGELLALLQFLDSPVDDLAFATFVMGDAFTMALQHAGAKENLRSFILSTRDRQAPLYSLFRTQYRNLWDRYFERLFNLVGYLPLYDLVAEIYKAFDLFASQADEEATLVKLLEVIKSFEESGNNSLKDFLAYAEKDEEESSDEWDIETAETEDAVRIMTVHKAKGLGFPILITLFYDRYPKVNNLFVVGDGDSLQLLRVTSDWAKKSGELAARYEESQMLAQVDDLNKLYVALTRAREEMYVLCVRSKRGRQPSQFLPPHGFRAGKPSRKRLVQKTMEKETPTVHIPTRGVAQVTAFDAIKLRETRRGELLHNILSELKYLDSSIEQAVNSAVEKWTRTIRDEVNTRELSQSILDFLSLPAVSVFFKPQSGRQVLNEQEVVDGRGALHRIDRLVVDPDTLTVLDYKTGEEKESYHEQVKEYMEIVRSMYPGKALVGLLLYVDRKTVREVR